MTEENISISDAITRASFDAARTATEALVSGDMSSDDDRVREFFSTPPTTFTTSLPSDSTDSMNYTISTSE